MGLPIIALKRDTVTLSDGSTVEVRELARREVLTLGLMHTDGADPHEVEARLLEWGTDTPADEVEVWRAVTPYQAVEDVVKRISELSMLDEDSPKG